MNDADLNTAILCAHDLRDPARLIGLYTNAADRHEHTGDIDAACFFLTQAYVFALEAGDDRTDVLHQRLVNHRRA
ncbi:hypothetical protein [Yoonia sp. 2307UL14-13]|uniref:hypothetical protein n=1 Tax=Yoonia sp. 2307UL14-13 TaxID=3126506 RepID=UPI0030A2A917